MKQDDFVEYVQHLQNKEFVTSRKPSLIINNFYSLITIVIISVAIVIYTNYILPVQEAEKVKIQKNAKKYNRN